MATKSYYSLSILILFLETNLGFRNSFYFSNYIQLFNNILKRVFKINFKSVLLKNSQNSCFQ